MNTPRPLEFKMKTLQLCLLLDPSLAQCQAFPCSLSKDITVDWGVQHYSGGSYQHFVLSRYSFFKPSSDKSTCAWIPVETGRLNEALLNTLDFLSRLISNHSFGSAALSFLGDGPCPCDLLAKETLQTIFKLFLAHHALYLERSIAITLHDPKTVRSFAELAILLYEQWRFGELEPVIPQRDYRDLASFDRRIP